MSIDITLTVGELHMAAQIGCLRQIESLVKKLPDRHGFDGTDGWSIHIEGAAGEIAVSKALNVYWGGSVNTFRTAADIGTKLEVRTRSNYDYDLIVRDNDKALSVYILVVGKIPTFRVVGWIRGSDAKNEAWLKTYGNRPAAYFVPQSCLNPIETLANA